MTVREALQHAAAHLEAHRLATPRRDAESLLAAVMGCDRTFLYTHPERTLSSVQELRLEDWLFRRARHYPIQYLRGHQEFFGRRFQVGPGVFIPRPETELLVEVSLGLLGERPEASLRAADIGTGSGCIGITLACQEPRLRITATDSSATALRTARDNARRLGCGRRMTFLQAGNLEPLRAGGAAFHLVVSNPPYVSTGAGEEVDLSVRRYEPPEAVFAGRSGLEAYPALFRETGGVLLPRGFLVLELGQGQAPEICRLAQRSGWSLNALRRDLAGVDRCAVFSRST